MTRLPIAVRAARALHRASLALHPRDFRGEFGAELVETFTEQALDAEARAGTPGVLALLARALLDTARTTLAVRRTLRAERAAAWRQRLHTRRGGGEAMGTLARDVIVGLRMLSRRPLFAGIAIGTLALGIGANTAIFSVVHGVLLRPLPFPDSEQLVRVYHANTRTGNRRGAFSLPDREDFATRTTSLSGVAAYTTGPSGLLLTGGDEAVEVRTAYVSAGFFEVLGREAYLGRALRDAEERGDNRVVVLSHAFWLRRFGGDESVVGRTIRLDDTDFLLAGVMPPDFAFPSPEVEAWVFLTIIPPSSIPLQLRQVRLLEVVGRIESGTTPEQAGAELTAVAASLVADFPDENEGLDAVDLVPLRESLTAGVQRTLLVLLAAVGLLLLLACANVANLLLSRAVERGRELDIRRALGAGRGRLVRQLLTESVLLSALGGGAGLALAHVGTDALVGRSGALLPRAAEIGIDGTVLAFSVGLTIVTALAFGLLPAMKSTSGANQGGLHGGARPGGRQAASRSLATLVASQVGLAMLVVISSGLLLRSLWALQAVDVGLESDRLVALSLTINDARYPERPDYLAAYRRLLETLGALPEVESVASIRFLPLRRDGETLEFAIPGHPEASTAEAPRANLLQVSPGLFRTAGVPILAGREFTRADDADAARVVIINDALRRRYWPGETPVGRLIQGAGGGSVEIVGVVGDIRQRSLAEDAPPTIYAPQAQNPRRGMAFLLRTASDPSALVPRVAAAVRTADPDQPIESLSVMDDVLYSSTAQPRFFSLLLMSFAAVSLLLATCGVYGVVSHTVSRRLSEIGIRVALGAPRTGVVGMVVRGAMRPVVVGSAIGLAAASLVTRAMSSILFGVSALDPVTFVAVPILLLGSALAACWLPATRAVRVDPTDALRAQ